MTRNDTDWSIQRIARLAGTTSRTLRHYAEIGLLPPARIGDNGYRYYDQAALERLQRILLLRELGLGLPAIAEVLDASTDPVEALGAHLRWLDAEQQRLERQIRSVTATIAAMKKGGGLMPEEMLDGFDHTAHREEVEERWGADAYRRSDSWWRGLDGPGREEFRREQHALERDYQSAIDADLDVASAEVQEIVRRHLDWVTRAWSGTVPTAEQFAGLGELYVADERFAAAYGGPDGARYVAEAMAVYAEREL
jgi:DNA-binding transcriptional MerR regulator